LAVPAAVVADLVVAVVPAQARVPVRLREPAVLALALAVLARVPVLWQVPVLAQHQPLVVAAALVPQVPARVPALARPAVESAVRVRPVAEPAAVVELLHNRQSSSAAMARTTT
jgi:hypothetical protein